MHLAVLILAVGDFHFASSESAAVAGLSNSWSFLSTKSQNAVGFMEQLCARNRLPLYLVFGRAAKTLAVKEATTRGLVCNLAVTALHHLEIQDKKQVMRFDSDMAPADYPACLWAIKFTRTLPENESDFHFRKSSRSEVRFDDPKSLREISNTVDSGVASKKSKVAKSNFILPWSKELHHSKHARVMLLLPTLVTSGTLLLQPANSGKQSKRLSLDMSTLILLSVVRGVSYLLALTALAMFSFSCNPKAEVRRPTRPWSAMSCTAHLDYQTLVTGTSPASGHDKYCGILANACSSFISGDKLRAPYLNKSWNRDSTRMIGIFAACSTLLVLGSRACTRVGRFWDAAMTTRTFFHDECESQRSLKGSRIESSAISIQFSKSQRAGSSGAQGCRGHVAHQRTGKLNPGELKIQSKQTHCALALHHLNLFFRVVLMIAIPFLFSGLAESPAHGRVQRNLHFYRFYIISVLAAAISCVGLFCCAFRRKYLGCHISRKRRFFPSSVPVFFLLFALIHLQPVSALEFTTRAIGQSTPVPGQTNRFTVSLVTDTTLTETASSSITISGLAGASAPASVDLVDAGNDGKIIFSDGTTTGKGAWSSGTLTLTVVGNMTAGTTYSFGFDVTNPSSAQTSPTINVAASGSATLSLAAMTKPGSQLFGVANGADPLTVVVPASLGRLRQAI